MLEHVGVSNRWFWPAYDVQIPRRFRKGASAPPADMGRSRHYTLPIAERPWGSGGVDNK